MTARDHWISKLTCSKCNQEGSLSLSEEGHIWGDDPCIEVDGIEGNFKATALSKGRVSVTCGKCRQQFVI